MNKQQRITEIERLNDLVEKLKLEAKINAGEDDAHKAIQLEIYQALGIQKGDWNCAKPVLDKFEQLKQQLNELQARCARLEEAALIAISFMSGGESKANVRDIYDESPQQSLATMRAEAVIKYGQECERLWDEGVIAPTAEEYAQSIKDEVV